LGLVEPCRPEHALACPSRKKGARVEIEWCQYLYPEFSSEALRILLPMADLRIRRRLNSFVAALQVGLRPKVTAQDCNAAQVAAVRAALDHAHA